MKSIRNIKLRTFCKTVEDLAVCRNHNPLQHAVPVKILSDTTSNFLAEFRKPVTLPREEGNPYDIAYLHLSISTDNRCHD